MYLFVFFETRSFLQKIKNGFPTTVAFTSHLDSVVSCLIVSSVSPLRCVWRKAKERRHGAPSIGSKNMLITRQKWQPSSPTSWHRWTSTTLSSPCSVSIDCWRWCRPSLTPTWSRIRRTSFSRYAQHHMSLFCHFEPWFGLDEKFLNLKG